MVTTVIPVFNAAAYLHETLESVAAQTRPPDRVVILDDCSTDDTVRIATEFGGLKCDIVRNEKNLGLFPNHNRALEFGVETDYLHILHGDDLIKPEFYERMLAALEALPGVTMGYCVCDQVDHDGKWLDPGGRRIKPGYPPRVVSPRELVVRLTESKALYLHAVLLRTRHQAIPCRFKLEYPFVADSVFHAELALQVTTVVSVPETLVSYRVHPASATNDMLRDVQLVVSNQWAGKAHMADLLKETGWRRLWRQLRIRLDLAMSIRLAIKYRHRGNTGYVARLRTETVAVVNPMVWGLAGLLLVVRSVAIRAKWRVNR